MAWPTRPMAAVLMALALTAPAAAESPAPPRSLCHGKGWIDYLVVHGRLTARAVRPGVNLSCSHEDEAGGRRENYSALAPACAADKPEVHYELTTPTERIEVAIERGVRFRITREPRGEATFAAVVLDQPATGRLVMRVGKGDNVRQVAAATFWHLAILEPAICADAIFPALETQRADWKLARQAESLRAELTAAATQPTALDAERCRKLMTQLTSTRFADRRIAERELRALGPAALPYLRELDRGALNRESKWVVREWEVDLARYDADTPLRVTSWLAADREIWLRLLADGEPDERTAAAQWLANHAAPTAERPALSGRE